MKKRLIALLLTVALLCSFGTMVAFAAGSAELVVSANKTTAAPGDSVTFTLTLKTGTTKVNGIEASLVLPTGLTYVSNTLGTNFVLQDFNETTGKINFVISGKGTIDSPSDGAGTGVAGDLKLMTVTCKVDSTAADGASLPVSVTVADLFDGDNATVSCKVTPVTVTVKKSTTLATPKVSSVANTTNGVIVKWAAVTGATNYRVLYKGSDGKWVKGAIVTGTSATVTGLTKGTSYTFTVRCCDAAGNYTSGVDTTGKTITYNPTTTTTLATPKVSSVANTTNGVTVKWAAVTGATNYRVLYKGSDGKWVKGAIVTGTSATVTGLTKGTSYTFTVRCCDAAGNYTSGVDTTGKTITYNPVSKLTTPTLSYIGTTVKGVEVKWGAITGAENYAVFYKPADGKWTKAGTTTGTSYVVTGLTSGTTYTFTVRCVSADGATYTSDFDSVGKTFTYLDTPVIKSVGTSVKGVEVKWNAVTGAENYGVFYKPAGGKWTKAGNSTGTSYVVTGLTSGTTYTFTVRCLSADGKTYMSGFDTVGKDFTYLTTPTVSSVSNTSTGVLVKWAAVTGATKYRVFYKTESGTWVKGSIVSTNSCTVTGLTKGTTYTFTVRCIDDAGNYTSGFDTTGKTITYK